MKYFLIIVAMSLTGCRVPYPSVGVGAPKWKQRCVTEYQCYGSTNNCRKVVTCYHR